MTYLAGIAFMFAIGVVIAVPLQAIFRSRFFAVVIPTILSTAVLKTWAYFDIGGFDYSFFLIVIGVSFAASLVARTLMQFKASLRLA